MEWHHDMSQIAMRFAPNRVTIRAESLNDSAHIATRFDPYRNTISQDTTIRYGIVAILQQYILDGKKQEKDIKKTHLFGSSVKCIDSLDNARLWRIRLPEGNKAFHKAFHVLSTAIAKAMHKALSHSA